MVRLTVVSDGSATGDHDWLEVVRLGVGEWRMSDARIDARDPARVLGYLERVRRGRYEVIWLTDPVRWARVTTFAAGFAAFVNEPAFAAVAPTTRTGPPTSDGWPSWRTSPQG